MASGEATNPRPADCPRVLVGVETSEIERAHLLRADEEVAVLAGSVPTPPRARVVAVPKSGGVRWLTLLDETIAGEYAAAVAEVASTVEAHLGPAVVANRVACFSPLALEPWRPARARFRRAAVGFAGGAKALLVADVLQCFQSTRADAVGEALTRMGCERRSVDPIVGLVEGFASEGVLGLPIGPEPSAVLANAVLAAADESLVAAGAAHLRWVDDFVVAADDAADADRKLEQLRAALAEFGLSTNDRKTRVIDDPALARATLLRGPVSDARPADRLRSDAHALPSIAGSNLLPSSGRGLDTHRRTPRSARGRR